MAATGSLRIIIGRDLPLDDCEVVFAPSDSGGSPGTLNSVVFSKLGAGSDILKEVTQTEDGYVARTLEKGPTLVLVVTVGSESSDILLRRNLTDALRSTEVRRGLRIWLPLMGVGAGGLSHFESLEITLEVVSDAHARGRLDWTGISLSLGSEVGGEIVQRIAEHARRLLPRSEVNLFPSKLDDVSTQPEDRSATSPQREPPRNRLFSDDLPTQIDAPSIAPKLRFADYAGSIVSVVEEAVGTNSNAFPSMGGSQKQEWLSASDARLTIGIFAPWGAGKSTLVNALRQEFLKRNYAVFLVNPWKWNGKGDLHDHVRATIIEQARTQGKARLLIAWLKLRTLWRNYGARLWWYAVVLVAAVILGGSLVSSFKEIFSSGDPKKIFEEFTKAISPEWLVVPALAMLPAVGKTLTSWIGKQVSSWFFAAVPEKIGADGLSLVYSDIATLIYRGGETFRPFVFFFDDLDRCTPERVAGVLESVHSLTAAGCVVFLSCDDEYVVAALNAHYEKVAKVYGDGKAFGIRYLEKIVQISFRLPLLRNADIFDLGIASIAKDVGREASSQINQGGGELRAPAVDGSDRISTPVGRPQNDKADKPVESARLQEIIGDLLGQAVEPLGLNVRQAKSISNTLKLYLKIQNCKGEDEARRLAAFVFADRVDRQWLDALYNASNAETSLVGAIPEFSARLAAMIGTDRVAMLRMFHLLGRQPQKRPERAREGGLAPAASSPSGSEAMWPPGTTVPLSLNPPSPPTP